VTHQTADSDELLAAGKLDALIGFPPVPQELRAKRIGQVIVNSSVDRPWSQYFCCTVAARKEFVQRNPAATKRAVRAILKATDVVRARARARRPRTWWNRGFTTAYELRPRDDEGDSVQRWREYDPEDSVRFYALRLREVGIAEEQSEEDSRRRTDWRFLNELKKELKG